MDAPATTAADPVAIVEQLDANVIATRLDALNREAAALRVLYKAAKAKARRPAGGPPAPSSGGGMA